MFLVHMIPFIRIGNSILVFSIKYFNLNRKVNKIISLVTGAAFKTLFLFTAAFIMVKIGFLPALFLTIMGLMQLHTALAGGLLAFGVHEIKKSVYNKN